MEEESLKEKFEMLKKIEDNVEFNDRFSDEEFSILELFSKEKDFIIRSEVARILVNSTCERDENILLKLSKDKNSLVRAEACDSLSISRSKNAAKVLVNTLKKDQSGMVRAYAIHSLGSISKKLHNEGDIKNLIKKILKKEKSNLAKISAFKVLYCLEDKENLSFLINRVNAKKYQNRCAVINCLEEISDEGDKEINEIIKETLLSHLEVEKNEVVISIIENLLKKLTKI